MAESFGRSENTCERFFWALQGVNYNVYGIVSATGDLVERYEYTPYGQRTVYSRGWLRADLNGDGVVDDADSDMLGDYWGTSAISVADINGDGYVNLADLSLLADVDGDSVADDPLVMHSRLESFRTDSQGWNSTGGYGSLCDIGHQGLLHDKEFGPAATGLVHNRARTLNPHLGRFMQRDPLGYPDGMNGYEYAMGSPVGRSDPSGTTIKDPIGPQKRVIAKSDQDTFAATRIALFLTVNRWNGKRKHDRLYDTAYIEVQWDVADDHTLANPLGEKIQWPIGFTDTNTTSSKTIKSIHKATEDTIEQSTEVEVGTSIGKEDVASLAGNLSAMVKTVHSESSSVAFSSEASRGNAKSTSSTPTIPVPPCKIVRVITYQQVALFYRRSYTYFPAYPTKTDMMTRESKEAYIKRYRQYNPFQWRDDEKKRLFLGKAYLARKKTRIIVGELSDSQRVERLSQFSK